LAQLDLDIEDPRLWQDPKKAGILLKQREYLKDSVDTQNRLETTFSDQKELWDLASSEEDESLKKEVYADIKALDKHVQQARLELLFSKPEDRRPCFVSIQAGSGGTEAQDWAGMLLRMYTRWAEQNKYSVELLEDSAGEEAGLKSATIKISGQKFPYGWLQGETGVHRLVRISPFDSNARRHTSFASISVMAELDDTAVIEILDKDLRIDTYRASGAGGQHVNKTDSAVRITHLPTGIVVQCQNDRSQHRNRAMAFAMLKAKLHQLSLQRQEDDLAKGRSEEHGITWGQQIRSYVLQPYQMVKDLRTGIEVGNPYGVLDGELDDFLLGFLTNKACPVRDDED
jgi:peptide chain release factor 2